MFFFTDDAQAIFLPQGRHEFGERMIGNAAELSIAVAAEGYRSGVLSDGRVRRMLGLSWHATETFLKERDAFLPYDQTDLADDVQTLERLPTR